jgi:hypothetical protein
MECIGKFPILKTATSHAAINPSIMLQLVSNQIQQCNVSNCLALHQATIIKARNTFNVKQTL